MRCNDGISVFRGDAPSVTSCTSRYPAPTTGPQRTAAKSPHIPPFILSQCMSGQSEKPNLGMGREQITDADAGYTDSMTGCMMVDWTIPNTVDTRWLRCTDTACCCRSVVKDAEQSRAHLDRLSPLQPHVLVRHEVYAFAQINVSARNEVLRLLELEYLAPDPLRLVVKVGQTDD